MAQPRGGKRAGRRTEAQYDLGRAAGHFVTGRCSPKRLTEGFVMRVQQLAWPLWLVGTALIVASWVGAVSLPVGWVGFAITAVGTLISWVPAQADPSQYPLTQDGFPVKPSGTAIPDDMALTSGMPLLAKWQGRWWRATVILVEESGDVVVHFPGWGPEAMQLLPRKSLQIDPSPNRQPITLPTELSGLLPKWGEKQGSEDIQKPGGAPG
jgi:hypothetical protein